MLTIKRSVIQHSQRILIVHSKLALTGAIFMHNKHTLAWHVMQSYCAQQRSVETARVRLFLHGGERINRTNLLYTPFPHNVNPRTRAALNYAVHTGIHVTLEELRSTGELLTNIKQTDYYTFPQDMYAKQHFGHISRGGWESSSWLSRPQARQNRATLLQMANRLLMRRGTQADLGTAFARSLSQNQPYRLQTRLENFHPHGSKLLELQRHFIRRYAQLFNSEQSSFGSPYLRERALPGLHEARRVRRRRSKLRGLLTSRGLLELRPRLTNNILTENNTALVRPHQLPFLNMVSLLSRQVLRSSWRRRRGLGLLRRTLRKTGRLAWDLSMCKYLWPLRQSSVRVVDDAGVRSSYALLSTSGVSPLYQTNLSAKKSDRLLRAFPFLFQSNGEGQQELK